MTIEEITAVSERVDAAENNVVITFKDGYVVELCNIYPVDPSIYNETGR